MRNRVGEIYSRQWGRLSLRKEFTLFNTDQSVEALKTAHSHRAPDERAQAVLREIRQKTLDLAVALDGLLPPSRERSVAQTKLDEVRMWACSAAVAGGVIREELTVNRPLPPAATT